MAKTGRRRQTASVSRGEFAAVVRILDQTRRELERCRHDLDIQFKRTAQVQAEIEALQRAVQKLERLT